MEDKKKNIRHVLNIIVILFITMLLVSGGTFAYLRWISSTDQQTGLAIQIEENINMHIENPLLTKAGMYPTNTCTNEAATMSGVSIIALENQTGVIARPKFKLRVKITDKDGNVITNNSAGSANSDNPYRYFINYAVAEENGICTEPLYAGNFDQNAPTYQGQTQWYDSEWITLTSENTGFPLISNGQDSGVSFNGTPYQTTYHNYKVWVWIDESYVSVNTGDVVSDKLQDAKIELSWSENSTVEQIKAEAYAVYSNQDQSLRFYQSDEPITVGSTYAGRTVTEVYTGFETASYNVPEDVPWNGQLIETVVVEDTIAPISTRAWFSMMTNASYFDLTKLDTSNVTDMSGMFNCVGYCGMGDVVDTLSIIGMENWDVSKVTDMSNMFWGSGGTIFNISDISAWNVSNVTNMYGMFDSIITNATNAWSLDLSDWNVYKVTNYDSFESSDNITPPVWYTSYAVVLENFSLKFYRTTTNLNSEPEISGLMILKVYKDFEKMEYESSDEVPWNEYATDIQTVSIENEIYPTSTVYWFYGFENCTDFSLAKLNTSNVTNMSNTFALAGDNSETMRIQGLENWDTSNVTNMSNMFRQVGSDAITFEISDISRWNTSKVTNMSYMFINFGYAATNDWSLDLSNWDVSKVTAYDEFNQLGPETNERIITPIWVN